MHGEEAVKVKFSEVKELKEYFSSEEQEAIRKEIEYLNSAPGRAQRLLDDEMERIQGFLE